MVTPAHEALTRELRPGEQVLWTGRPSSSLVLWPVGAALISCGLVWGSFALSRNMGMWTNDAPFVVKLLGLPLLLLGVFITVGRFVLDRSLRPRLIYAVTDRRVLILKEQAHASTISLDLTELPALELIEHLDGFGTIRFGASAGWSGGRNLGTWQLALNPVPRFIRVPNARVVYDLIQEHSRTRHPLHEANLDRFEVQNS